MYENKPSKAVYSQYSRRRRRYQGIKLKALDCAKKAIRLAVTRWPDITSTCPGEQKFSHRHFVPTGCAVCYTLCTLGQSSLAAVVHSLLSSLHWRTPSMVADPPFDRQIPTLRRGVVGTPKIAVGSIGSCTSIPSMLGPQNGTSLLHSFDSISTRRSAVNHNSNTLFLLNSGSFRSYRFDRSPRRSISCPR